VPLSVVQKYKANQETKQISKNAGEAPEVHGVSVRKVYSPQVRVKANDMP